MDHDSSLNLFDHTIITDFIDNILFTESRKFFGDGYNVRQDFAILKRLINGYPNIYFDNGASSFTVNDALKAMNHYYCYYRSNVGRSSHTLSREATKKFKEVRELIPSFLGSKTDGDVVFTRGTTDSVNVIIGSLEKSGYFKEGDTVIVTEADHNSIVVPFQQLSKRLKLNFRIIPLDLDSGEIRIDKLNISDIGMSSVKLVGLPHTSNVTGLITPVKEIVDFFKESDALILLDGAQSVAHINITEVIDIIDFFVFSSHKVFGPTGLGVVYSKPGLLEKFMPHSYGGGMIKHVTAEESTFQDAPFNQEAGTPSIAEVIGFGATIKYLNSLNRDRYFKEERIITEYLYERLSKEIPGIKIIGELGNRIGVIAFHVKDYDLDNIADFLDKHGVACRVGNACASVLHEAYKVEKTLRISLAVYNTMREAEQFMIYLNQYFRENSNRYCS